MLKVVLSALLASAAFVPAAAQEISVPDMPEVQQAVATAIEERLPEVTEAMKSARSERVADSVSASVAEAPVKIADRGGRGGGGGGQWGGGSNGGGRANGGGSGQSWEPRQREDHAQADWSRPQRPAEPRQWEQRSPAVVVPTPRPPVQTAPVVIDRGDRGGGYGRSWDRGGPVTTPMPNPSPPRGDGGVRGGGWGGGGPATTPIPPRPRNDRWQDRRDGDRNRWDRRDHDGHGWDRGGRDERNRWDRRDNNDWWRNQPNHGYGYGNTYGDYNRWNRDWRRNSRYDWEDYRYSNRSLFRSPYYYHPYGGNYGYRRFSIGFYLDTLFFSSRYWISDPWYYRLPPVYGSYRWVRYYNDVLLVDLRTGEVVDVVYDFFW